MVKKPNGKYHFCLDFQKVKCIRRRSRTCFQIWAVY